MKQRELLVQLKCALVDVLKSPTDLEQSVSLGELKQTLVDIVKSQTDLE